MTSRRRLIHALLAAKARVAHGWTTGRGEGWVYGRHVVCAIQAIELGSMEALNVKAGDMTHSDDLQVTRMEASSTLLEAVNQLWPKEDGKPWDVIPAWNDEPGRKKTEVLEAFDRALKIAGHDG